MFIQANAREFNWPLKNPVFTSHFGESRYDHWHNGIDVVSARDNDIKAPQKGEVIYYHDEAESPFYDGFGAGNYLVVEHENNLRTIYYHLEQKSIIKNKNSVTTEDTLAVVGNSGRSFGAHLHLILYSTENDRILNPIDYFQRIPDTKPPVIKKILLKPPMSDAANILKYRKVKKKSDYRVIVAVNDVREGPAYINASTGVRNVELFIDDALIKKLSIDYLGLVDNKYCLNGERDLPFSRVYEAVYHIDLGGFIVTKDTHKFRVITKDNGGNSTDQTVNVTFY